MDNHQKANMKTHPKAAVVAIVIGALLQLDALQPRQMSAQTLFGTRAKEKTIRVDGRDRIYFVYLPKKATGSLPVVIVLHGGGNENRRGSKGRQMERYAKFNTVADREGFIVCYPEGVGGNWNDGRGDANIQAQRDNVDDIKFIRQMVDQVARDAKVNRARIFATGISNGGFMSHRLAAEASDLVLGIAPLVGGLAEPIAKEFRPKHPVSLFVIQGEADPLVPYGGGEVGYRIGKKRGKFIATEAAVAKYVAHNGIQGKPTIKTLPDKDPADKTTTRSTVYPAGRQGAKVQFYFVKNGGHTWPGQPPYLPERLIGNTSQDFDATEEIWKFFKSCPSRP